MDEPVQTALADIERRLTALEARQPVAEGSARRSDETRPEPWQFLGILVPIAVFAWLSGSSWAWGALGIIGVACVGAAAALALRTR